MTDIPLFSVSQFTTMPQSFEDDVALYSRLGIEGIEMCEQKLPDDPDQARRQLEKLKDAGLTLTSAQPTVHSLFPDRLAPQPKAPEDRITRFKQTIDLIAEVFPGMEVPLVTIGGAAPDHNYRRAFEAARQLFPDLADYAADHELKLGFEPIHPVLMNFDTFVYRLEEAQALLAEVDRPNFGLVLDVWHLWPDRHLIQRIPDLIEQLFIVHLSDWPLGGPRCLDDRVIPGQGMINFSSILSTLDEAGYDGAYCLELLSSKDLPDSLWMEDPAKVIQQGQQGFEQAWKQRTNPGA